MSLVIANSFPDAVAISADTRAVSTVDGPLPDPFAKIRLWECANEPVIVAAAGETIIDGIQIFEHIHAFKDGLRFAEGRAALLNHLIKAWERDFEQVTWDSQDELNDYLESARISVLLAPQVDALHVIDGYFGSLQLTDYLPMPSILAFGTLTGIEQNLAEYNGANWLQFIANTFASAADASHYVAAPVDIAVWHRGTTPTLNRFQTFADLLALA